MPTAQASVTIPTPARYMARLCNHFAHRVTVHRTPENARVDFPGGVGTMQAMADRLEMHIEANDVATIERLKEVVSRHLKQVAPAETFEVNWANSPRSLNRSQFATSFPNIRRRRGRPEPTSELDLNSSPNH